MADTLRLPKLLVRRYARPVGGRAWNPVHRRVARFWDATRGLDGQVIEALRAGQRVEGVKPLTDDYARQMQLELTQCRARRLLGARLAA